VIGGRAVAELQLELALVNLDFDATTKYTKATLLRRGYTRLTMQPDKNHQRPHFHILFKTEYSASYAIDTLGRLAGYMPREYEAPVLKWAARYRRSLAAHWKSLKNGEDVREMVIVARRGLGIAARTKELVKFRALLAEQAHECLGGSHRSTAIQSARLVLRQV